MEQLLNDRKWKSANRLCSFLSLIPVFGFFGFLFMGRKSGRKQYRNLGIVYGALMLLFFTCFALSDFFDRLSWSESITHFFNALEEDLYFYGSLGIALLWPVCFVHTMALSGQYLQYLALRQVSSPSRSPLTADANWRTRNLSWMLWAYLPYLGGFALIFAGKRMKKSAVTVFGVLSVALTWGLEIASVITYQVCSYGISNALSNLSTWLMMALWIGLTLTAFWIREDYLDARAADWTRDTSRNNVLLTDKWRNTNSRWQIWTGFPYLGGIGIFIAGVRSRRKRYMLLGAALSLLILGMMLASVLLQNAYYEVIFTDAADPYRAAIDALETAAILCYFLTLFSGCCIRWDTLVARAASLQGYRSEFERELDLYNRRQARQVQAVPAPPAPPVTQTQVPANPVSAEKPIDINNCTMEEMMTLPGIGIAQARHAMEYRSEKGGFRSVDEFIEVLQIKPHFAVQILSRAAAFPPPRPTTLPDSGGARRRIDF